MALGATDPQLVLKTTPPRIPKTVLERTRLGSGLAEFAEKSVITLQAAAGSGKTSLLAQWRKEALVAGAIVAWLTLDDGDNDSQLARGLTVAMRASSGRPGFGQECLRAAESEQRSLEAITEWLAEVAAMATESLLILDDVHALPESTLNSSLVYLLLNAPANLKIVLASRRPIKLPVSGLPGRGRFVSLSTTDLRFDQAETVALLKDRFGRRIDPDSCVRLHQLTEGWALGLQLAISTIERSPDIPGAIAGFSVLSSDVHRYFVECLIDQLPPALARFLVCISIVDDLSPSLCKAMTKQNSSTAKLRRLHQQTPVFTEAAHTSWLRIHPLAREFLQERFAKLPRVEQLEYHTRAGDWLAEHQLFEEAARHLLEAGLEDRAYGLIERSLHELMVKGQVSRVADWAERLPFSEIERRTSLRLTVGWMLAQSERHTEAAKLVASIIDDASASAGERCESAEICATAAVFADDIDHMGRIVASWYEALPTHSPLLHLVGINQLALLTLYRGSPEQARYGYAQIDSGDEQAGGYALGWRDWIVGISYIWEGHVELAAQKLRVGLGRAEAQSGRRSPIAVMLASALATALLECDRPEEAAALLADRLDILERRAPPDAIEMGFVTAVRLALIHGEERRAFDLLDHLLALGEARKLPRLCIASLAERIRVHVQRGRGDVCAVAERKLVELMATLENHSWGLLRPVVESQTGLAHAYAAVARRDWQSALERLDTLVPQAERLRRGREALQSYLLRALAREQSGENGAALLEEALSMAGMWGLARIVADTHPELAPWRNRLHGTVPAAREDARGRLTDRIPATRVRVAGSSLLSPKEREVLELLAGNMSNKQIALAMDVSSETVKWHLKNLFGKLNAGTRKHLLDRARMMGILDTPG